VPLPKPLGQRPPPRSPPTGTPRPTQPTRSLTAPGLLTCATPMGRKGELPGQGTATKPSVSPGSIARRLEDVKREDDALSDVSDWESHPASAAAPPGAPAALDQAKQKLGADQPSAVLLPPPVAVSLAPQQRSGSNLVSGQCSPLSMSPCATPPTPQKQLLFTPPQTPLHPPPARPAARLPLQQIQQPQQLLPQQQQQRQSLDCGDPPKRRLIVAAATMLQRRRLGSGGG